jgi:photosystem I subunit 3
VKRLILSFSLILALIFNSPNLSFADGGILVDCDKSAVFNKRLNTSLKKLETRLKKYEANTPPSLAIQEQILQTKNRFARYSDSTLMCGTDGLPHIIADGDWAHATEFMLPGMMFLYTTGWIGWSGRKYLQTVALSKNPTEKEIIIDVPVALNIMISSYLWPRAAWDEFISGEFVIED